MTCAFAPSLTVPYRCSMLRDSRVTELPFRLGQSSQAEAASLPLCMKAQPSPSPSRTPPPSLSPYTQSKMIYRLSALNSRAQMIKCPFWRRRFTDSLEVMLQAVTWAIRTRHKSLPLPILSPLSSSPRRGEHGGPTAKKLTHLDMMMRLAIIRQDFIKRQYYVTGRLTAALYRDDCLFDGPDPDGRVRGLRKFCDAAAGLFDTRLSHVDLVDIYVRDERLIVAEWRLQGALMLPWRPYIKPYLGSTLYEFDDDGLVCSHVETWRISVVDAFLSVVWKGFGTAPAPPVEVVREKKRKAGCLHWSNETTDQDDNLV